jgi:uncharacterized OB-fold protein
LKTRVPFREGLFEEKNGRGALLGARCRSCGQVIFPARQTCPNCRSEDMEKVRLSGKGTLYSYTIVHMTSQHFEPPYAIGWVELPENVKVFSQLRGWQEHPLKTGMALDLGFESLWQDEEKDYIGYVFRPAGNGGGA